MMTLPSVLGEEEEEEKEEDEEEGAWRLS